MKVFVVLLTALLVGCIGNSAFAQIAVEMEQRGEYRYAVSADHWESAGINITDEAQRYIDSIKKAIKSPGEFIPVLTREVPKGMISLFGLKRDLVAYSGVVYYLDNKEVKMINDPTVLSSSVVFSPFIVWWILAFMATFLLNMRHPRFEAPIYDVCASVAAVLGLVFSLLAIKPVAPFLSTFLFAISIAPTVYVIGRQEKKEKGMKYWIASIVLYIMLGVLLSFTYLR